MRVKGHCCLQVAKDCGRDRYFTPKTAIEYGIMDTIITHQSEAKAARVNYRGAARDRKSVV